MTVPMYVVAFAVGIPALIYLSLAIREAGRTRGVGDFFPLSKFIPGHAYGSSTAAAGVSLATVILALVNLTPFLGIGLLITVASYIGGFIVLYLVAPRILRANPNNLTVQAFLGRVFASSPLKLIAIFFTFVGYVSIFSMELLVGVTVLEPIYPGRPIELAVGFLSFIILYSAIGGFRAIVATEQWQIRFVVLAVVALALTGALIWWREPTAPPLQTVISTVLGSWHAGWAFCLGILAMNLPAAISDAGTWQRLCATRTEADARIGLRRAMVLFALIWGSLILAGCFIATVATATGDFNPSSGSLMTFIVQTLASGGVLGNILLFVFILGLLAALITTADSLLLVAAQMISLDVLGLGKTAGQPGQLIGARAVLVVVALASFALFAFFQLIGFNVVELVFAVYGAQLALFPAVALALFWPLSAGRNGAAAAAITSIVGGFALGWGAALYGKFGGDLNWTYNAPAVALAASIGILVAGLAIVGNKRAA